MPVEIAAGSRLPCIFELARILGLAMSHTIELGLSVALAPLGLLAGRPEIHNVSHSSSRWYCGAPICAGPAVTASLPNTPIRWRSIVLKALADESVRWCQLLWGEWMRDFNTRLGDRNGFQSDCWQSSRRKWVALPDCYGTFLNVYLILRVNLQQIPDYTSEGLNESVLCRE
jgi:hypothetical protein